MCDKDNDFTEKKKQKRNKKETIYVLLAKKTVIYKEICIFVATLQTKYIFFAYICKHIIY
jgi:hypothetical protein